MKITVTENGEVEVDGIKKEHIDLNTAFFEKIVKEGLENNVEFIMPEEKTNPIVMLMESFEKIISEDSDFRKEIINIENELKELEKTKNQIENENYEETEK